MRYGRPYETSSGFHGTRSKFFECESTKCVRPQRMPRVCRSSWVVVKIVEPLWEAWTPCKIVETFVVFWM